MKTNSGFFHRSVPCAKVSGLLVLAAFVTFVRTASGCGDYASMQLIRLAGQAISTNEVVAQRAIASLRERGPAGLQVLLRMYGALVHRPVSAIPGSGSQATATDWERLTKALDSVGAQRDCASSRLYWHTDFDQAKAAAKASGKPILSLRLLGRLDEEFSCANSRFFRTALYANAEISAHLRARFILHWQSVRPAPRITIDFGDGRKLERTITGNSIHYILDGDGRPVDALPGLYGPKAFLQALIRAEEAATRYATLPSVEQGGFLRDFHRARLAALTTEWARDLAQLGETPAITQAAKPVTPVAGAPKAAEAAPITRAKSAVEMPLLRGMMQPIAPSVGTLESQMTDRMWARLAALHSPEARLDEQSVALMRRKYPDAVTAAGLAVSKVRVEDPLVRAVRQFEQSMAEDTVRNEYAFHSKVHQWFAEGDESTKTVVALNLRVYAELFLTPDSDPWLGLKSEGVYSALELDGVVQVPVR